jgi:hypothetical protein
MVFSPGMSEARTMQNCDQSISGEKVMLRMRPTGYGRAHRRAVPHARQREVVNILRCAEHLGAALLAKGGSAEDGIRLRHCVGHHAVSGIR